MKTYNLFSALTLIAITSSALVACTADQNVDSYRQNKVNEKLSMLQSIGGTYRGTMTSAGTETMTLSAAGSETLGAITLVIQPDTKVQNSSDNLSSELQAVLTGVLTWQNGAEKMTATFQQALYDDQSNQINITIPFQSTLGENVTVSIQGSLKNGVLIADVDAGFPEFKAKMNLTKDGPAGSSESQSSGRSTEQRSTQEVFTGTIPYMDREIPLSLSVTLKAPSPKQSFLSLVYPKRQAVAIFTTALNTYTFDMAEIDFSMHTLSGQSLVTEPESGNKFPVNLDCTNTLQDNVVQSWVCTKIPGSILKAPVTLVRRK